MKVTVRLFAAARVAANAETLELEIPEDSSISELRSTLVDQLPQLKELASTLRFAINEDYATDTDLVQAGDDIACIPPVSGG